jgi:hypothetical protein
MCLEVVYNADPSQCLDMVSRRVQVELDALALIHKGCERVVSFKWAAGDDGVRPDTMAKAVCADVET